MTAWAVRLDAARQAALARLYHLPNVEVLLADNHIWLRGPALDDDLDRLLRGLPQSVRFTLLPGEELLAAGKRVPHGFLPRGNWQPLRDVVCVKLPLPGWAGQLSAQVGVRLVRSQQEKPANVLRVAREAWLDYAGDAPQVRLERWSFAAGGTGDVIVRGEPLPPLRGLAYAEKAGIAIPVGWTWSPAVDAPVLCAALKLSAHDLALLHPDGTWDLLPQDTFVRATRSAIRLSCLNTS